MSAGERRVTNTVSQRKGRRRRLPVVYVGGEPCTE